MHNQVGVRLDAYLASHLNISRQKAKNLIKEGHVLVNKKIQKAAYLILENDIISGLDESKNQAITEILPYEGHLDIVYEDKDILVINKPIGISVHPSNFNETNTLVNILKYYNISLSSLAGELKPGIVHRLDKYSEGIMLIAKTDAVHKDIKEQFKNKEINKHYYAIVKGNPLEENFIINSSLNTKNPKKITTCSDNDPNGKTAETHVKVLKRFTTKTLVEASPITGRTHQIRIHLASKGFPILGDNVYGKVSTKNNSGQLLQAYKLTFIHPIRKIRFTFELPISERLKHNL